VKKWFLCLLVLLCACAPPKTYTFDKMFNHTADFDKVWTAVIETFGELNLPVENMEKDSGLIVTDWISVAEGKKACDYCDCGGAGLVWVARGTEGKFNVFVKRMESGGCSITVNTSFRQLRQSDAGGSKYATCNSSGQLETRINTLVSEKLNK
jgi:hypothetical protein